MFLHLIRRFTHVSGECTDSEVGDIITDIDRNKIKNINLNSLIDLIARDVRSEITLAVLKNGMGEPLLISMQRNLIKKSSSRDILVILRNNKYMSGLQK